MTCKAHLVFVYGSLKEGFHNNSVLDRARKVTSTKTVERFEMQTMGSFPAVRRPEIDNNKEFGQIAGEVYYVNEATLADLDRLESNGFMYQRELVEVDDVDEPVWMYLWIDDFYEDYRDPTVIQNINGVIHWTHPILRTMKES